MGWGWGLIDLMIPWMRVVDGVKKCVHARPIGLLMWLLQAASSGIL